jgi:hypothetical protein
MMELVTLLAVYYTCAEEAAHGRLTQTQRFACNETYQQAKNIFLDAEYRIPGTYIPPAANVAAYRRFKAWEAENADLVADLKGR